MAAFPGLEMLLIAVVDQGIQPIDGLDPDVAAAAAITAVRAAEFDEFLASKANAAGTALAGADIDLRLVEEFHGACVLARPARLGKRDHYPGSEWESLGSEAFRERGDGS